MSGLPSYDEVWSPGRALMRHQWQTVQEVLGCIDEGVYCTLLGPHFSGKTLLVQAVAEQLSRRRYPPYVYVDLARLSATSLRGFFASLAGLTAQRLSEVTGRHLAAPDPLSAGSAAFRGFVTEAVTTMSSDLVLLLDHLEALPGDLAQALLTSLRAAYMEQQPLAYHLLVVASGALSLATHAVGESSPFRGIARRIFVGDVDEAECRATVDETLRAEGMPATERARDRLVHAARGDPHLLRLICRDAIRQAQATASGRVTARTVETVVRRFLEEEVSVYAPLQEAVRAIEDDPDLLRCVVLLLEHGTLPRSELPLPLSPDADPLYLTGVVERLEGDRYRLRNDIYRRTLARRLDPGRVGYLLTIAGRWDSAIDYLEASIGQGNERYRADVLPATLHSIYAADDLGQAAHFLLRGLAVGFGVHAAQVWVAPEHENRLRLVGRIGDPVGAPQGEGLLDAISFQEDRLEARAYREAVPLRGHEGPAAGVRRAIPLLVPGRKPLGVVCLCDWEAPPLLEGREAELQLMGYLNQAARAFQLVGRRTQEMALAGRVQSSLLPPVPDVPGWELAAALLPARRTSGDFYDFIALPGGRLGIVIADVADKGLGAALFMALSRTLLRSFAAQSPADPAQVATLASQRMLQDAPAGLFVTAFYGILDPATGDLTYCNAGHPPPVWLPAPKRAGDDAEPRLLPITGMALGAVEETTWRHERVRLAPGDLLLLYTDGLPDAQNADGGFFGRERVLELLRARAGQGAAETQEAIIAAAGEFVGNEPPFDDMTLVVIRRQPAGVLPEPTGFRATAEHPTFRVRVI